MSIDKQNLVIDTTDLDVQHPGVDLVMGRTYNSLSQHNVYGSDGAPPAIFGNGWSSSFDIRLTNNSAGGVSIFDGRSTRYDYTPVVVNGVTHWNPEPGNHDILTTSDGGQTYYWYRQDGSAYGFFGPNITGQYSAYSGRLSQIWGRNTADWIKFTYGWTSSDSTKSSNLASMSITTDDSRSVNLTFSSINGHPLVTTLQWPNQQDVTYAYDSQGDLQSVTHPSNDPSGRTEEEIYVQQGSNLVVESPDYVATNGQTGATETFLMNAGKVTSIQDSGVMNFTPTDGTAVPLHPTTSVPTGLVVYNTTTFSPSTGQTVVADSEQHQTNYTFDTSARVTTVAELTSRSFITTQGWDTDNNLISQTDYRGYETDLAYDAFANLIAQATPQTSSATYRYTQLYSYDNYNDVTAECSAVRTHSLGLDWTTRPAAVDNLCPSTAGSIIVAYTPTQTEPWGEMTQMTSPNGYVENYSYATSGQSGVDRGLMTQRTGPSITQVDGSPRVPTESFTYDSFGDLASYNSGIGTWTFTYDTQGMGEALVSTDPDGVSSYQSYTLDGSVISRQSASQHAAGISDSATYDQDGNVITEVTHNGNATGTKQTWYDGADRPVEVAMATPPPGTTSVSTGTGGNYAVAPPDSPSDAGAETSTASVYPWLTRYQYDVTAGKIPDGATVLEYGGMYQIQEFTQTNNGINTNSSAPVPMSWMPIKGFDSDAIGRTTAIYQPSIVPSAPLQTFSYDAPDAYGRPQTGFMTSVKKNGVAEIRYIDHDELGQTIAENTYDSSNNSDEPGFTAAYDADGHVTTVTSAAYGAFTYAYDLDGNLTSKVEPTTGSVAYNDMPSKTSYAYYADDLRSSLSVAPAPGATTGLNAPNLMQYAYRGDGLMSTKLIAGPTTPSATFASGCFNWTYTNAGRAKTQQDPFAGCGGGTRSIGNPPRKPLTATSLASVGSASSAASSTPGSDSPLALVAGSGESTKAVPSGRVVQANSGVKVAAAPASLPAITQIGSTQFTYDSYGRVASETLPAGGTYNTFAYDQEDQVTNVTGYAAPSDTTDFPGRTAVNAYTVRGELAAQHFYAPSSNAFDMAWPHFLAGYYNGTAVPSVTDTIPASVGGFIPNYWLPDGAVSALWQKGPFGYCNNSTISQMLWNRDGAGRDTSGATAVATSITQSCAESFNIGSATRSFDFDNRQLSFALPTTNSINGGQNLWESLLSSPRCDQPSALYYNNSLTTYLWGVEGHAISAQTAQNGATQTSATLHWDGDDLLFTSSGGKIEQIHSGDEADLNGSGQMLIRDRDATGNLVQTHDGTGASAWQPSTPFMEECSQPNSPPSTSGYDAPADVIFRKTTSNGYFDGISMLQGEHLYDPQMNRWATPDEYQGEIGDPYSTRGYTWNKNNPNENSDPSGFDSSNNNWSIGDIATGVPSGGLSGSEAPAPPPIAITFGKAIWDGFIGEDLAKVRDRHAPLYSRAFAGAMIVMNVIPGPGELKLAYNSYRTFRAFKIAYGVARAGYDWHHVVEARNVGKFGVELIHNRSNLVQIERTFHRQISAFYSRKDVYDGVRQTFRDYASSKSFEEQTRMGWQVMRDLGYDGESITDVGRMTRLP